MIPIVASKKPVSGTALVPEPSTLLSWSLLTNGHAWRLPCSSTGTDLMIWLPRKTMPATAMKNSTTRIAPTIRQALRQPLPDDLAGAGFQGGVPPPAGTWPGGTAAGAAPQPGGGACWTGAWGAGACGGGAAGGSGPAASRAGEPPRAAVPSRSGQEPPVRRARRGRGLAPARLGRRGGSRGCGRAPVAAPARLGRHRRAGPSRGWRLASAARSTWTLSPWVPLGRLADAPHCPCSGGRTQCPARSRRWHRWPEAHYNPQPWQGSSAAEQAAHNR